MSKDIPAFPDGFYTGMTLRDYFAAKAMQGMLSLVGENERPKNITDIPKLSYRIADAMMEARDE